MKKILLITAGCICVALAIAGVLLPLLPTTPFLLLAAACFVRSSDRLYQWLVYHRLFGVYIRSYREYRAVPLRAKIISLSLLWITIGSSAVWFVHAWWLRAILAAIALGVTAHILSLRTLSAQMRAELRETT